MKINDFPILKTKVHGHSLVYLDNSGTTQKPSQVIDAMQSYYLSQNANIHRAIHYLSECSTVAYEQVRKRVQQFINAQHDHEIVFVRGATEAINLIAHSYGNAFIKSGDEILISTMEHHSNIVPWQLLCERVGAVLRVIPMFDNGELDLDAYQRLLNDRTKLVAVVHVSNAIGTINPVKTMIEMAHQRHIPVLVDGAQAVPHMQVDVQKLNCDFYVFSGHKMYGPTGIGILYGKTRWLEKMLPYQGGGDMISQVTFEKTEFNQLPYKFEAGTPNIAGVIGLGAAVDYLETIGMNAIAQHEHQLMQYATQVLSTIPGLRIVGTAREKAAAISFVYKDIHPHDIGTVFNHEGIAIRAGHHCTMPLMQRLKIPATARISFGMYNTKEDIDSVVSAFEKLEKIFPGV